MPLDVPFIGTAVMAMLKTIPLTLAMTFFPILFGFIIAIGLTLIRMYHVRFLEPIAKFYVSFFRSTPAILHIMLIYLGIPLL
ncbi:ABC transporter permease subunit, partial [Escherichia coli]|nr:ABC transporter permease subunit [Escherichia coli]